MCCSKQLGHEQHGLYYWACTLLYESNSKLNPFIQQHFLLSSSQMNKLLSNISKEIQYLFKWNYPNEKEIMYKLTKIYYKNNQLMFF